MDSPKTLLFALVFLGTFALLFNGFVTGGWLVLSERQEIEYRTLWALNTFYGTNFSSYDREDITLLDIVDFQLPEVIGANNLTIKANMIFTDDTLTEYCIEIWQYWTDFGFLPRTDHFNPRPINKTYFLDHITELSGVQNVSKFNMYNSYYTVTCIFTYDNVTYTDLEDAWDNADLNLLIGLDEGEFSDYEPDIWNLFGQLMLFQAPEIHPALNAIIAIPLWVLVVYIIWQIVVSFIP